MLMKIGKMQEKNVLNRFKDILGQYCAICQFMELSKRCFVNDHAQDIVSREKFICLATKNEVTLTNYDAEAMIYAISRNYIVNVHLCLETFLKEVEEQLKIYGRNTYQVRLTGESYLSCITRNLVPEKLPKNIQEIYDLCEYYRLVRNLSVHDLCNVGKRAEVYKNYVRAYNQIQKYNYKKDAKFDKLSAPNEYANISFDDFVMFARSCVELATYLFQNIAYDYEKIILKIPHKQIVKWKRYDRQRCERVIVAYLNTVFAVDHTLEGQISHLVDLVMAQ